MPDNDRDYTLPCGCYSGWADHRCMGGTRPAYCSCGAPDDCYCPSPSEQFFEYWGELTFPLLLDVNEFPTSNYPLTIIYSLDQLFDFTENISALVIRITDDEGTYILRDDRD